MVVKQQASCRHCGATLKHALSRCPQCGKRSWINLLGGFMRRY